MQPHPWFRPLYRRVLVLCLCLIWLALELWSQPDSLWVIAALAVTAWGLWDFFLSGNYRPSKTPSADPE
ncbi:MAG: DUF3329 domain-containing protein [Geminicoccaceae bacterium]